MFRDGGYFDRGYSLPEDSFKQGHVGLKDSIYASTSGQYPATYRQGGSILSMSNTPQLEGEGKDLTYPDGAYVYANGGYTVTRSNEREGKTHKVVRNSDGKTEFYGHPMKNQPRNEKIKEAAEARHRAQGNFQNPFFKAYWDKTWENGGPINNSGPRTTEVPLLSESQMRSKMAYEQAIGNKAADRMLSLNPKTYDFGNGDLGTHYMTSIDNYAVPILQDKGENNLEYIENPPPSKEDFKFQTPEEAEYFATHYKTVAPMITGSYKNGGEMIKRADGSYSKRGLWDNIRANRGSGKEPTKEMLRQELKIRNEKALGGVITTSQLPQANYFDNGGKPKNPKLITYKTDSKLIDGTAAFDLVSKVPISDDYNQQIKERLYTGKWGFDPESGALIKLNKSQQTTVPQNISNIRKEEKEDQEYRAAIQRGEINPRVDTTIIPQANKQMTPQEVKEFVRQGYDATILNPAFQTAAYFTPPGMAIGAIQGAANLIPDLYEGNYGEAVVDAASILPFARPITQKAKSAIKKDWLQGYKEIPKSGTKNVVKAGSGGMDMSRYEIKNPDYFTQLLDTYTSSQLSPSSKKFYKGLIASVKKQDGIVTERQYQELQRLKTGNFNYGPNTVKSGIDANAMTRPLTMITSNELTPGQQWYRKIGNEKGLQDLIDKQGAQAPGPMRMKSGAIVDAPFFGKGNSPVESYRGLYAVELKPEARSKYNMRSYVGGVENYGSVPFADNQIVKNVPLEDLNVYRKKFLSNNYKQLDPNNLEAGLKNAALQRNVETGYKWGVRGLAADQIFNDGEYTDKIINAAGSLQKKQGGKMHNAPVLTTSMLLKRFK